MSREADTSRRRNLTPEEAELWRRAMEAVKPLKKQRRSKAAAPPPSPPAAPAKAKAAPARPRPPAVAKVPVPPPPAALPDLVAGKAPGVDKRTASRLRRGRLDIEARIDLHGHTQDQAHRALNGFIAASADAGRRCVLVVTGKGSRDGGIGVIRAAVPRWLNMAPLRDLVLAINPAQPQDGGDGALYVLLKRRRAGRP